MTRGNRKRSDKRTPWSLPKKRLRFTRNPSKISGLEKSRANFKKAHIAILPSSPLYLAAICLVVALVAAAFVFHLHVRFEGVRLGYETSQARAKRAQLLVEQRELRLELASLKSPERVKSEAIERLSMEVPDHRRIVVVGKQKKAIVASGGAR